MAEQLRQLILHAELLPGERLPAESELTVMFGVSRSTVREALRVLSSDRLITTGRGVHGGSFVTHPEPEHISDYLQASLGLLSGAQQLSIDDLLEARELLEVPAARLAATRRTEAQLEDLRRLASAPNSIEAFAENRDFHVGLLEASGNLLLGVMTRPVFTVLQTRFRRHEAARTEWDNIHHAHEGILEAVEAGDGELAAERMLEHLEELRPIYSVIDLNSRSAPRDGIAPKVTRPRPAPAKAVPAPAKGAAAVRAAKVTKAAPAKVAKATKPVKAGKTATPTKAVAEKTAARSPKGKA